jgi:hypothetical protein
MSDQRPGMFTQPYRVGHFAFSYRARAFVVSPKVEPVAAKLDPVPMLQQNLLVAVAGVIVTQWEKIASWLIAGFSAALALVLSNYAKAVELTDLSTVYWVLALFVVAAVLHVFQRLFATIVQAGVAGGEVAAKQDMKDLDIDSARRLLDGMAAAYPWPLSIPVKTSFRRIKAGDIQHVSKDLLHIALAATLLALLQVGLGLWAIVKVWLSLHTV